MLTRHLNLNNILWKQLIKLELNLNLLSLSDTQLDLVNFLWTRLIDTVYNILLLDGCVSEVTSSLFWPEVNLGTTVFLACPCGGLSLGRGRPVAQRTCNGSFRLGAEWSPPKNTQCNFNTQLQLLCNVTQVTL